MPEDSVTIRVMLRGSETAAAGAKAVGDSIAKIGPQSKQAAAEATTGLRKISTEAHAGLRKVESSIDSMSLGLGYMKYAATAALGAVGATAIKSGLQFDATMESNTLAFKQFLGSAAAAKQEVQSLFQIAAHTPFEFADITTATRRMLAFGFSIQDVNKELAIVGDAIAGMGGGAAEINSLVLAIGQIRAKGRLQGQEMLQLNQLGILSEVDIAKQLGMDPQKFQKAMQSGSISSDSALAAINTILDRRFHGAAEAQGKTFSGQFSTLKDMSSQALGQLTMPLFTQLRDRLFPQLNRGLSDGSVVRGVQQAIGTVAPFFTNVLLPAAHGVADAFKVVARVVGGVATALGYVSQLAAPFKDVIQILGEFVGFGVAILGIRKVGRKLGIGGEALKAAESLKARGSTMANPLYVWQVGSGVKPHLPGERVPPGGGAGGGGGPWATRARNALRIGSAAAAEAAPPVLASVVLAEAMNALLPNSLQRAINQNLATRGPGASSPSNPAGHVPFIPGPMERVTNPDVYLDGHKVNHALGYSINRDHARG